jgi:hypothetical protein
MHIKTFSLLSLFFAIAAGTLGPSSASFAAKHPESKTAAAKKAVSGKKKNGTWQKSCGHHQRAATTGGSGCVG